MKIEDIKKLSWADKIKHANRINEQLQDGLTQCNQRRMNYLRKELCAFS